MASPIVRLIAFTGASLVLHVVTLGVYGAGGSAPTAYARRGHDATLQAVLAPLQVSTPSGPPHTRELHKREPQVHVRSAQQHNDSLQDETIGPSNATGRAMGREFDLLFDRWYGAEELDVRAEPLTPVNLTYPTEVPGLRVSGRVRLALYIDERGWVRKVKVITSHPERTFDEAAIKSWEDVRFTPAQKDGEAVKSEKILEIEFSPF